jgi:hypothetical protein
LRSRIEHIALESTPAAAAVGYRPVNEGKKSAVCLLIFEIIPSVSLTPRARLLDWIELFQIAPKRGGDSTFRLVGAEMCAKKGGRYLAPGFRRRFSSILLARPMA